MKTLRQGGFLISKIHQLSSRIFTKKLKEYRIEINSAQGRILFVLWQHDEIPINELAQKTALGKSTLTGMLDRLETLGYLTRVPSREDRREILIKLTSKNQAAQQAHEDVSAAMLNLYYRGFEEKEIEKFEAYLQRIYDNLVRYETD